MKTTNITPQDQALLDAILNVSDNWHEFDLPDHPVYPQFKRKLVVAGFLNSENPDERIYIFVNQQLIFKEGGQMHKSIKMPTWEIYEHNVEEIENAEGKIEVTTTETDDEGKIISESSEFLKAPSIKYIRFLLANKQAHLVDVFQKFMYMYVQKFATEIDDI